MDKKQPTPKVKTSFTLSEEAKRLLKLIADQDDRSEAWTIDNLIKQEAARRNLK